MGSIGQWAPGTADTGPGHILCFLSGDSGGKQVSALLLSVVLLRGFVESRVPQFLFHFALKDAH